MYILSIVDIRANPVSNMVNYVCEGYKFHSGFDLNCRSLLTTGTSMDHVLSRTFKKWMKLDQGAMHNMLLWLCFGDPIEYM